MTKAEATSLVRDRREATARGTGVAFAIVGDDGRLLGSASVLSIDRQRSCGLIAYWLAPGSRGKGIGTRAVSMLCEWAFTALGLARLELTVDVRNEPSQRLAERVGFQRQRMTRSSQEIHGERIDEYLYSLVRSDVGKPTANLAKPS